MDVPICGSADILKVGEHELTCENRQGRGMDLDIRRDRRTI